MLKTPIQKGASTDKAKKEQQSLRMFDSKFENGPDEV